MIRRLHHWTDHAARALALAGMAVLSVAIMVVLLDVLLRATINRAILGTVDITQLCVMAAAFWSMPLAFTRGGHVSVEIGTGAMPVRLRHGLDALAALLGAGFVGAIGWYGWSAARLAADYGDRSQNLGLPMTWYWAFLLSGAAASLLAALSVALRHALILVSGREESVEEEPLEDAP